MIVTQLRKRAAYGAAFLALAGFAPSTPGQAVQVGEAEPLAEIARIVAELEDPASAPVAPAESGYRRIGQGEASYYGHELAGNRTANGERFNPQALTAAHRTLPMGTRLRVTNRSNGKSVIVRINDRGPFAKNRIIDVSLAAAHKIQMVRSGTAMVTLEKLV